MATKTCPSCNEDVPIVAARCKHCFHNFDDDNAPAKKSAMGLLVLLAAMVAVGSGVFWYLHTQVAAERVVIEEESQSIIITRKSASKTEATRVAFAEVTKVEYVLGGEDALYEVVAVTANGERYIIQASEDTPLDGQAELIARTMDKPMERVRNITTIGD